MKNRIEQYGMLVAGAAGVAFAGAAGADVVVDGGNVAPPSTANNATIALDLDNDGTVDINIVHTVGGGFYGNDVVQATGGLIGGGFYANQFASATAAIANATFASGSGYMRDGSGFGGSGWTGSDTGFLAVQFTSGAFGVVNGYVEVFIDPALGGTAGGGQFPTPPTNVATVLSYGFENNVPEPGSLGLLALGAVGLLSRRKKSA